MSPDERELRELDRAWNEAYPNRDTEALARILADDWTCIDGAGHVVSKGQLIERVASNPNLLDSHEFDEFSLRLFGDAAVVTGRLSGSGRDREGPFSLRQRYTRVYVRRGGVWQAVATQVTVVPEDGKREGEEELTETNKAGGDAGRDDSAEGAPGDVESAGETTAAAAIGGPADTRPVGADTRVKVAGEPEAEGGGAKT